MGDEPKSPSQTSFSADGPMMPDDHTDPKFNALSINDFKPDALQQQPYDNPALVLDQLHPIDMSSSTLLINQTPPAENHVENSENSNPSAIDRVLDEHDASGTYSLQQDEVVAPLPRPDTPLLVEVEHSEDINPFHASSSVFSASENDAPINQPSVPDTDHGLLRVGFGSVQDLLIDSLDNQHPTPLLEPQKHDHTEESPHDNDSSINANLDPFPKSDLVTEHENFSILSAEPEPPKADHTPESPHDNDNSIIANLDPFPTSDLVSEQENFSFLSSEHPKPDHTPESPRENDNCITANFDPFPKSVEVIENENLPIPSGAKNVSNLEVAANLDINAGSDSPKYVQDSFGNRVLVDTSAPFDSVKDAVSKFGGIVDWKAHKVQTGERRIFIEQELEKTQEEVPVFRKMSDKVEEEKFKVLQELEAAKRLIEDMKLNVERAQTEEHQARQDAELVKLRVEELEQGIAEESSVAAKAQLEVAKARQAAAVSDLQSAKEELESLRRDYAGLMVERDMVTKKAEQAMAEAKEVEKTVQDLTIELIGIKESLESAHAVHLEAEARRVTAATDKDQSAEKWGKELREVENEVRLLEEQVTTAKDLRSKLDAASVLLGELKAELANYMESKMIFHGSDDDAVGGEQDKPKSRTHTGIQASVASAKKELEDVRANIEKAIEEVDALKVSASSLQSELESEKLEVEKFKHIRDGTRAESVEVLEVEVNKIELELVKTKIRETEATQKMTDLTMRMPQVAQDADRLKSAADEAREELMRVKEEAEQVKAEAIMMESRVVATEKETEAAKASEKLALGAIQALRESDNAKEASSSSDVTVSVEEYYELGKRAHEAEEEANARVAKAEANVEEAKESQLRSMEKLEEVDQEVGQRKEELDMALKRAEAAVEGKLRLEEELRQWRSRSEEERSSLEGKAEIKAKSSAETKHESSNYIRLPTAHYTSPPWAETVADDEKAPKKKKRSFFPRILMFMARRKAHSSKH